MRAILSAIPILLWLLLGFLYQPCWKAHCGGQNGDSTSSVSSGEATENNETLSPTDDVGDADNGIVESSNDEGIPLNSDIEGSSKGSGGNNDAALALSFNWNSESAISGSNWKSTRETLLNSLGNDEMLTITGLYEPGEQNTTAYDNLGLARAHAVAALFKPPLSDDRIILKASLVDEGTLSKESAFEGVNIGSEKMAKKVEKIANKTVIRFPYNSVSKLDDKDVEEYLDQVAERVIASGEKVILTGHTDSYGDEASNRRLGRYRANVIKEYLVAKGVPVQQIQAFTKGESDPIASNRTAQGRAQNRRTELQIIQ